MIARPPDPAHRARRAGPRWRLAAAAGLVWASPAAAAPAATPPGPADPRYLVMPAMQVPLAGGGRASGRLVLELAIETASAADAATLAEDLPRLRETLWLAALDYAAWHGDGRAAVNPRRLVAALQPRLARGQRIRILAAYPVRR